MKSIFNCWTLTDRKRQTDFVHCPLVHFEMIQCLTEITEYWLTINSMIDICFYISIWALWCHILSSYSGKKSLAICGSELMSRWKGRCRQPARKIVWAKNCISIVAKWFANGFHILTLRITFSKKKLVKRFRLSHSENCKYGIRFWWSRLTEKCVVKMLLL